MRDAFIVLLVLIIRVTSRYIKTTDQPQTVQVQSENYITAKNITFKTNAPMEPATDRELPKNRSNIDEIDLYNDATSKQNNHNERSFIFINQVYKRPNLHPFYKLAQTGPELYRKLQTFITEPHERNYALGHNHAFSSSNQPMYIKGPVVKNLGFKADFVNKPSVLSLGKIQEEVKLLDQYMKDSVEDEITNKERAIVANLCKDCNVQTIKASYALNRNKGLKTYMYTPRDRSAVNEAKYDYSDLNLNPSDMSYYEELLREISEYEKISKRLRRRVNHDPRLINN